MAITAVKLRGTPLIGVVTSSTGGGLSPTATTLTSTGVGVAAVRLDQLVDVNEPENPSSGMTLVYDEDTDEYNVEEMNLDGGTF